MMKKLLPGLLSLLLLTPLFSQVTTSNIIGAVSDDQNAPIQGTNIVALHTPAGTRYGVISIGDGRFNLFNLGMGGPCLVMILSNQEILRVAFPRDVDGNLTNFVPMHTSDTRLTSTFSSETGLDSMWQAPPGLPYHVN